MNCWVAPREMPGFVGLTAMDWSVAGVTVKVVVPETLPDAAVIVAVPTAAAVALPLAPAALLMEATDGFEELQVTVVVRFCVLPSE